MRNCTDPKQLQPLDKENLPMRKFVMILTVAGVGAVVAGLAAAPVLYAEELQSPAQGPGGSMIGPDMQHMTKMMEMCGTMMRAGMMQGGTVGHPGSPKPHEK